MTLSEKIKALDIGDKFSLKFIKKKRSFWGGEKEEITDGVNQLVFKDNMLVGLLMHYHDDRSINFFTWDEIDDSEKEGNPQFTRIQ